MKQKSAKNNSHPGGNTTTRLRPTLFNAMNRLVCAPRWSRDSTPSKKNSWKGSRDSRIRGRVLETAFEKVLRGVLRRCLAMSFRWRKGSGKGGSKKGLLRKHLEGRNTPLGECEPSACALDKKCLSKIFEREVTAARNRDHQNAPKSQIAIATILHRRSQNHREIEQKQRDFRSEFAESNRNRSRLKFPPLNRNVSLFKRCQNSQRFRACGGNAQSQSQESRDFGALSP